MALFARTDVHFQWSDGIVRLNQIEMLVIKSSITEMKNVCDGPICRLNRTKERINELEDSSV